MSTPPGTADPYVALADELGRIGHRLDGMGAQLLALRSSAAAGAPAAAPGSAPWSHRGDAPAGEGVASGTGPVSAAPPAAGAAQVAGPAVTGAGDEAAERPAGEAERGGAGAVVGATDRSAAPAGPPEPGAGVHPGAAYAGGWYPGGAHHGPGAPGGVAYPGPGGAGYPAAAAYAGAAPPVAYPGAGYPPGAAPPAAYPGAGHPPGPGWPGGVPAGYPGAQPAGVSQPGFAPGGPGSAQPGYGGWMPPAPPRPPADPARPRTSGALSGARLLAWVGGAVTLLGVVMLLVLAASRGWFSPPVQLSAAAVLGVALVGLALWLHRRETARAGALALAATGFATLYLVVAAATAVYDYLAPAPALLLALVVAGAGLGIADRWRSQLIAAAVTGGAAVLAPVLAHDWLLVALVLALQVAAVAVVLRRSWPVLMLVAAAGPVLYGMVVAAIDTGGTPAERFTAVALALAVLVVALGTAVAAARRLPVPPVAVLVGAASLPAMAAGLGIGGWRGAALVAVAGLAMAGFAVLYRADRGLRTVAATAAAVDLFLATATALDGHGATLTIVVLAEALVAVVLAAVLRSRFALVMGMVFGGLAVIAAITEHAPLSALVQFPADPYVVAGLPVTGVLVAGAAVSALVLALAGAVLVAGGRLGWIRPDASSAVLWVPIGLIGLYGATGLVVTLAILISPDRAGFVTGHALVTVSWTVAALVLLARGISRPALRIAGLVLVAAAVAKLVLFDLVALDGLARVGAFLGAGLVLLAAGTRYARLVAEAEKSAPPTG